MRYPMVDLAGQYQRIQKEIDEAIQAVVHSTAYVRGPEVEAFEQALSEYLGCRHVVGVGNGTDALQLALMALDLEAGDEVVVPAFTFIATAEVVALLGLKPVMAEVDLHTFTLTAEHIEAVLTPRTRVLMPVHLFGQSCDMEPILALAERHGLYVVEDNAQAIGAAYTFSDGTRKKTGTMGHIGCISFFPSKNLGCFGDGGACCTDDDRLAERIRMLANHGMRRRYYHELIGINSRLDSIQAAVLGVKLRYLDAYNEARRRAADHYDALFAERREIHTPVRHPRSTHVFHQYTLRVPPEVRDALVAHLHARSVGCNVYYPVPLHRQRAFAHWFDKDLRLPVTERLCREVLSLPMHTELTPELVEQIGQAVCAFWEGDENSNGQG